MTMTNAEIESSLTAPGSIFEVTEAQVQGITMRVWKNAPPTLRSVLELSAAHGDKDFIVYEDERLTFAQHVAQVATLAQRLRERYGVEKGDRVAIVMRNFPEWIVAFWASVSSGAVVVPLNAWWTGPELEYGLTDSGATVVFVDAERLERLAPHLPGLREQGLRALVLVRGEASAAADADRYEAVLGEVQDAASTQLPAVEIDSDDDATIFYTSGTTGHPKGALGTHRNFCTSLMGLAFGAVRGAMRSGGQMPDLSGQTQESLLLSVPLFHVTGCHAMMAGSLAFGGKLVMMHKWDPERALELIERERITTFGGVPAMVWQVLESPSFATHDISSVKSIGYGGAPAPPELVRRIDQLFPGRTPSNGFGMTETSAGVTSNTGSDYLAKPDSVGRPVPINELKVIDELGDDLPPGQLGELCVKGPNVVKGYWNRPEATAATFQDGWLRTGDIARIDEDGFVYLVDRAKDMIIRGGENVYCAEVESALFEHPAVTDAAVIGIPHQILGEEVGAVVQLKPAAPADERELQDHVRQRLAAFKVPVRIWIFDQPLPRNPAGKILKRELRDSVLGTADANVQPSA